MNMPRSLAAILIFRASTNVVKMTILENRPKTAIQPKPANIGSSLAPARVWALRENPKIFGLSHPRAHARAATARSPQELDKHSLI
jgi:hypothetical protein